MRFRLRGDRLEELPLPAFRYHPDPLGTGSVTASDDVCRSCGAARGYIYSGPAYAAEELGEALCPWCIADGRAADTFDVEFTDVGVGVPAGVPSKVIDELRFRTPGFSGWQQEHWLYHCGDAAAFIGPAGRSELELHPDALEGLRRELLAESSADDVDAVLAALDRDDEPTAYLFRCLHCGVHLAYADFA
jgi:uncharacterized protein CbrC (UPF0167 family)